MPQEDKQSVKSLSIDYQQEKQAAKTGSLSSVIMKALPRALPTLTRAQLWATRNREPATRHGSLLPRGAAPHSPVVLSSRQPLTGNDFGLS